MHLMRSFSSTFFWLVLGVISLVLPASAHRHHDAARPHGLGIAHPHPQFSHHSPDPPQARPGHSRIEFVRGPAPPASVDFALTRRGGDEHSVALDADLGDWYRNALRSKYGLTSVAESDTQIRYRASEPARRDLLAAGIPLETHNLGGSYIAPITVGTSAEQVYTILDTGSTDTWVLSSAYDPSNSSSYAPLDARGKQLPSSPGATVTLGYGGGSVSGTLGHDDMQLGNQIVTSQPLVVADTVSSGILTGGIQGVLGMAFPALSKVGAQPLWMGAGLSDKTFGFRMSRVGSNASSQPNMTDQSGSGSAASTKLNLSGGTFTLGGTNESLYDTSDINWLPVSKPKFWMVHMGGISAGSKEISLHGLSRAGIDTGTTLIGGPSDVVQAFYKSIPEAQKATAEGYWTLPCSSDPDSGSLPNMTIHLGARTYTLAPEAWIVPAAAPGLVDGAPEAPQSSTCVGILFDMGTSKKDDAQWIVGSDFLSLVYTIFDANDTAHPRVGLAPLVNWTDNLISIATAPAAHSDATSRRPSWVLAMGILLALTWWNIY